MRYIDLETWPRRAQYEFISTFDYPHFNMSANMDITAFYTVVKQQSVSITVAIVYVLARAAHDVAEFRQRIREDGVVEHDIVHPSTTYLTEGDLFSFCRMDYSEDFSTFAAGAEEQISRVHERPSLEDLPGDDQLFMTAIPWVSFTSFMHPIQMSPVDSIPRFAWAKFFQDGEQLKMPLNVQAHHGLVDGVHMGRYYEIVQDYLDDPDYLLAGV